MGYTLQLLDTCSPDYFQGFAPSEHQELIAVSVWCEMTPKGLYDAILDEWRASDDSGLCCEESTIGAIRTYMSNATGAQDCTQHDFAAMYGLEYAGSIDNEEHDSSYQYFVLTDDLDD